MLLQTNGKKGYKRLPVNLFESGLYLIEFSNILCLLLHQKLDCHELVF